LLLLAPFVDKAMTIDDPLFIWVAGHILEHPLDPYGFKGNWFGQPLPMTINVQNPPLTSYWLALVGLISWKEAWLHLAMLPWACLLVWGVIRLSGFVGADPFWSSLLTVATSAFLVSATNVMCDVMMLALMIWAVSLWVEGLERGRPLMMLVAGVLASLAALAKYFALATLPLLLAYTLVWICRELLKPRKPDGVPRATTFAVSKGVLFGLVLGTSAASVVMLTWHFWSRHLYGTSHILTAAQYAQGFNKTYTLDWPRVYATFTFVGGCLIWPLAVGCRRISGVFLIACGALVGGLLLPRPVQAGFPANTWSMRITGSICFAAGIAVLCLIAEKVRKRWREPGTWLLFMWIAGTFFFVAVVNWTVAARNVLPLVPALALLAGTPPTGGDAASGGRHLDGGTRLLALGSALGIAVALTMTWADWAWANSVRDNAHQLIRAYSTTQNRIVFQGHWGFQYYMTLGGARAMDFTGQDFSPGDVLIVPSNNTSTDVRDVSGLTPVRAIDELPAGGLYLSSVWGRAGFYSHLLGPLPFVYNSSVMDKYLVFRYVPGSVEKSKR
jgi:hypothetical protein